MLMCWEFACHESRCFLVLTRQESTSTADLFEPKFDVLCQNWQNEASMGRFSPPSYTEGSGEVETPEDSRMVGPPSMNRDTNCLQTYAR